MRNGVALFGGLAKPFSCFGTVFRHAVAIGILRPKDVLGFSIAFFRLARKASMLDLAANAATQTNANARKNAASVRVRGVMD